MALSLMTTGKRLWQGTKLCKTRTLLPIHNTSRHGTIKRQDCFDFDTNVQRKHSKLLVSVEVYDIIKITVHFDG